MNITDQNIQDIIKISLDAGVKIMEVYQKDFQVEYKEDESPLTEADTASNAIIVDALRRLFPQIPIISEENKLLDYNERKDWKQVWLVDPIDGTKEFIKKNGEFTVNIALVENSRVVVGVVHVPAQNKTYYASKGKGAYLIDQGAAPQRIHIRPLAEDGVLKVVGSRSHKSKEVDDYVQSLESKYPKIEFVAAGSSLKFCLVAEGLADVYPRLAPTMEWDTCAGQIVALEAGAEVLNFETNNELEYNKENLLNPHFIVKNPQL